MNFRAALRALHYRNFQLFIGGQLISSMGTWTQNVAQAWLVYRLTGSSVLLGTVGFLGQIAIADAVCSLPRKPPACFWLLGSQSQPSQAMCASGLYLLLLSDSVS